MCPRLEAQFATIDRGGGGGDPGQGRTDPPLPGCRHQAARRTRPGHPAGQAHGLRQFRLLLAVQRPVGAMRTGQQPDPADARQPRSDHHQSGAAAQRRPRRRRTRQPAPLGADGAGPEQLRTAIRQRRTGPGGSFLDNLFGNNNSNPAPRAPISARNPAPSAPSACAPATAPTSRSRSPPFPPPLPRRRKDLQGALPGGGSHPLRLSQSRRRHEPGGLDQRPALLVARRTHFATVRNSIRPAPARPPGKPGPTR